MTSPPTSTTSVPLAPSLFLPHGGGPMPLLNDPAHIPLNTFLTTQARTLLLTPTAPKALIVITAHWESPVVHISTAHGPHHLLYDYGGFPPETYNVKFDARGDKHAAARVIAALSTAGIQTQTDAQRGWDHGVFVPLKLLLGDGDTPESRQLRDIPIVVVGVLASQSADEHYRLGQALGTLRKEGYAVVGSGMSFHNMRAFRFRAPPANSQPPNAPFDTALEASVGIADAAERGRAFSAWEQWDGARDAHPVGGAEHFMPAVVCAGAGGDSKGERVLRWEAWGFTQGAYVWR
ncbi:Extradiol ring-cleavage dioxygenase, class III enzyme, subunit B [Fimicolochytrium jonesii]|uniref:Extradiol ring-cleavage dioxygenase, class III enzyme, subunit B n=1 Tax=Fimicolochytrium jonesii TaxID=1396493 RepID=UPI0022FEB866|nr:Extradiol ring-cleavage dioxygenase, class III enzyme, subunit B [Fimicolochytrium jonesii]KAI8819502.1 Extradiol ring-cleavage dioxygenase, class III enzyme, subunit B [Fimicolochytrium jonesii]